MNDPRTLVFGDDSSPAADIAWLFINNHRWPGWRLEVVAAQMPEIPRLLPPEETELHEWKPLQPRDAFAEAQFAEVVELTAKADPRVVLSRNSDLLVIGPRGPGLLKALHLGSTADWLLLHPPAPCSSLVTVKRSAYDHRIDVDTATGSARARLEAAGATVDVRVESGKPTTMIHRHLTEVTPDLVVLGTRGLTGLSHHRLGSTASAVTSASACSVLITCDDDEYARTIEPPAA
jgi:nucleotide-binding universal stress UspA family protein